MSGCIGELAVTLGTHGLEGHKGIRGLLRCRHLFGDVRVCRGVRGVLGG